jgi:hypothetical protein
MGTPYSRQEVAYLVGPLLGEDPDHIIDVVIIAVVDRDGGEERLRMRGPVHTPLIIANLIADCIMARYEMREDDDH